MSDEAELKLNIEKDVAEKIRLIQAEIAFEGSLKLRSFSERNRNLGKMIKCAKCCRRHRDEESCGTYNLVVEAKGQRPHPQANPFWRAHPGKYAWIQDLKKFVTIHR